MALVPYGPLPPAARQDRRRPPAPVPTELVQSGLSLGQVGSILLAYRLWIAAVTATVLAVTAVVSVLTPRTYTATATVLIDYRINDAVTGQELSPMLAASYLSTQVELLRSPQMLLPAIDRLGWASDPAVTGGFSAAAGDAGLREFLADRLAKSLDVSLFKDSRLMRIRYSSTDRDEAARVANAVAETYLASRGGYTPNQTLVQGLRSQLATLETRLAGLSRTLGHRHPDRIAVAAEIESVRARLDLELAGGTARRVPSPPYYSVEVGTAPTAVKALELLQPHAANPYARVERRTSAYYVRFGGWDDRAQAEAAQQALAARGNRNARVLQVENAVPWMIADGQTVEPGALIPVVSAGSAPGAGTGRRNSSNASLVSEATPPLRHSRPRLALNLAAGGLAGLVLGIALALVRELTDRRLRCREDMERDLGVPVLAELQPRRARP